MKHDLDYLNGTLLRRHEGAEFALTETAYSSGLRLPRHSHQTAYFCLVLEGTFTEIYGRQTRACGPSTLIFHPQGEEHADHFHSLVRCFNLPIATRWTEDKYQSCAIANSPRDLGAGDLLLLAMKVYREFRQMDEISPLIIEGLMLEIVGNLNRHCTRSSKLNPPPWLVQARQVLRDRFRENLSLAEIAVAVGVHETHLARAFRRYHGCTIGEYIRHLRIELACQDLSVSGAPIAEVAQALGFFDQSHFGRIFKQYTGMSPALYRKIVQSRKPNAKMLNEC